MAGLGGNPNQHDARLRRLHVEPLEDRRMLATFAVSNLMDGLVAAVGDLPGSLRQAVFDANNAAGADTIDLSAVSGTLLLTDGEFELTEAVTVDGPGQNVLTIDAQQNSRIFNITAATDDVVIRGLKLINGKSIGDNISAADSTYSGGAIRSVTTGQLIVEESKISGSSAQGDHVRGGGIFSDGPLSLVDSILTGNYVQDIVSFTYVYGGGLSANGSVTVTGSTLNGNVGGGFVFGGGIHGTAPIEVTDSTISDNLGGGIAGVSHIEVTDSTISGNSVLGGGGGIRAVDTLTVTRSTISDNTARIGGGISVSGTAFVEIIDSTISGNTARRSSGNALGGGIWAEYLRLERSTVSGNTAVSDAADANAYGGGIYSTGQVILSQSTVSGNSATYIYNDGMPDNVNGGGIVADAITLTQSTVAYNTVPNPTTNPFRGGIWVRGGPVVITGSIVAGNGGFFSDLDSGSGSLDVTHSLIGINLNSGLAMSHTPDANGNLVGGVSGLIFPLLDALRDNGGPTETHALTAFSPAIDLGDPSIAFSPTEFDQRGSPFVRVFDADGDSTPRIDMGAYERNNPAVMIVDTTVDENDGDYSTGDLSLREAVFLASLSLDDSEIFFNSTVFGTPQVISLTLGQMGVGLEDSLSIHGPGQDLLTIDAQQNSRIFDNQPGPFNDNAGDLIIEGLTLTGGQSSIGLFAGPGGAIRFGSSGNLTIKESTITGSSATGAGDSGGAIYSTGPVYLSGSTIHGNSTESSAHGGGLYVQNDVTLTRSTISDNDAAGHGGGIYTGGNLTISNSTISGNSTTATDGDGGGIFSRGDLLVAYSTITDNHAPGASSSGGGIWHDDGTLSISGSIVAENTAAGDRDIDARMGPPIADHSLIGHNAGTGLLGTIDNVPDGNGNLIGGLPGGELSAPLQVSIDIAAMGEFESGNDSFQFDYALDFGGFQTLFNLQVDMGIQQQYTLEDSSNVFLFNPLRVVGNPPLNNTFQTYTFIIPGSAGASTLDVRVRAMTTDSAEAFAFRNLIVTDSFSGGLVGRALTPESDVNVTFVQPDPDYTVAGSMFGIRSRSSPGVPGLPDSILDDSVAAPPDTEGIIQSTDTADFFGVVHTNNGIGGSLNQARWTFDVLGQPLDPVLGSLADNGGPTQTHMPLPGSPAIDAGNMGFTSPPDYDQRGFAFSRVVGGRIDMGAVESGAVSADFDLDGVVSGLDFLRWQLGAGTTGTAVHSDGDANIDANVDGADETVWELQYGTVAPLVAAGHPSLALPIEGRESAVVLLSRINSDDTARPSERAVRSPSTAPALDSGFVDLAIAAELLNVELRTSVVRRPSSVATDHGPLTTDKLALHDAVFRELDHLTRQHQDAAGVLAGQRLVDFSGNLSESDVAHHGLQPLDDVPLGGEFFPDL